jgi:hypothetical protein
MALEALTEKAIDPALKESIAYSLSIWDAVDAVAKEKCSKDRFFASQGYRKTPAKAARNS